MFGNSVRPYSRNWNSVAHKYLYWDLERKNNLFICSFTVRLWDFGEIQNILPTENRATLAAVLYCPY